MTIIIIGQVWDSAIGFAVADKLLGTGFTQRPGESKKNYKPGFAHEFPSADDSLQPGESEKEKNRAHHCIERNESGWHLSCCPISFCVPEPAFFHFYSLFCLLEQLDFH